MEKYGLIGFPLQHSFSKKYFTEKFAQLANDCSYENYELEDISSIRDLVAQNANLYGLNVTIPHKESVLEYLDEVDSRAALIGAVNTIKIYHESDKVPILSGYNTDVLAFKYCIMKMLLPDSAKALVLGTGGASKAVQFGLKESGIDFLTVSRIKDNHNASNISYEDIDRNLLKNHKLIINCTPLGTTPNENSCPEIPYHELGPEHILFDLVYNPPKTLFMQRGEKNGAKIENGYEMLKYQAERSWDIWTGKG